MGETTGLGPDFYLPLEDGCVTAFITHNNKNKETILRLTSHTHRKASPTEGSGSYKCEGWTRHTCRKQEKKNLYHPFCSPLSDNTSSLQLAAPPKKKMRGALDQRFEVITSSLNQEASDKSETCVESSQSSFKKKKKKLSSIYFSPRRVLVGRGPSGSSPTLPAERLVCVKHFHASKQQNKNNNSACLHSSVYFNLQYLSSLSNGGYAGFPPGSL